jgi:hypothetical protein
MSYFDPNKETMLIADASPVGLAALLTQEGKIITRNSSHFKKIGESIMNEEEIEEILDGNNSDTPDTILRRSSRERRPPKYLDDYACSK